MWTRHGRLRAVRHDVAAVLATRPFDRDVRLTGRHGEALRVDQEVLNQRLHLGVDLVLRRRHDAAILDAPLADRRDALERLAADLDALPHLRHAHQVAVVDVAVAGADDIEVERVVARIREGATHVVVAAGGTGDRAVEAPVIAILQRDDADTARAIEPDRVLGDQRLVLVQLAGEAIEERRRRPP